MLAAELAALAGASPTCVESSQVCWKVWTPARQRIINVVCVCRRHADVLSFAEQRPERGVRSGAYSVATATLNRMRLALWIRSMQRHTLVHVDNSVSVQMVPDHEECEADDAVQYLSVAGDNSFHTDQPRYIQIKTSRSRHNYLFSGLQCPMVSNLVSCCTSRHRKATR
jgi:hypothetical protein